MQRRIVIFGVAIVIIGTITGVPMFIDNMVKKRTTWHSFEIDNVPRFLTEETAIAFGRKALAMEGLNAAVWEPQEDGRTVDPDGHTDKHIARNSINPNRVSMVFRNKADAGVRCVDVEMEDNRVVCAVTIPK